MQHAILMKKLSNIAAFEYILHWISNFLASRTQRMVLQGHAPDPLLVTSVVPQESFCDQYFSPLLLMTYPTVLIADDTLVYQEIASFSDCRRFQRNLDSLGAWSDKSTSLRVK